MHTGERKFYSGYFLFVGKLYVNNLFCFLCILILQKHIVVKLMQRNNDLMHFCQIITSLDMHSFLFLNSTTYTIYFLILLLHSYFIKIFYVNMLATFFKVKCKLILICFINFSVYICMHIYAYAYTHKFLCEI